MEQRAANGARHLDQDSKPVTTNPVQDVRVRQAIAHAIDAKLIVDPDPARLGAMVGVPAIAGVVATRRTSTVR